MTAIDYHGKIEQFEVGTSVTYVADNGVTCKGRVLGVEDGLLHLSFTDGEEGWEKAEDCFT